MERIREILSRRVFGVPVGAFAAIAAAVLLYFALRMKSAKSTDTGTGEDATGDEPASDADPFGGDKGNPVFEASPKSSTVIATPVEDTNELWAKRARTWLIGQGLGSIEAQALIQKYLNSQSLTTAEKNRINQVLDALGYPPDPPDVPEDETPVDSPSTEPEAPVEPPVSTDPGSGGGSGSTPPTKQGEPPCMHRVVNTRDNGPGELARLYFGSNSPEIVNKIEAANLDIGPGPWAPGTKVKIPANVQPAYFTATSNVRGLNEIAAKNGVSKEYIKALNPGMDFPVKVGTKVRVR